MTRRGKAESERSESIGRRTAGSPYSDLPLFQGTTFDENVDEPRLGNQLRKVRDLMMDGKRHTLREIAETLHTSEAGVSARIRDCRKARFFSLEVPKERLGHPENGVWVYWFSAADLERLRTVFGITRKQ